MAHTRSIRNHNLLLEQGSATTGGLLSDPSVQVTLEAPFARNALPSIVLTPIGTLANVHCSVESITYNASTNSWTVTIASSVPSITVQYRVIGYSQNNRKISIDKTRIPSGDGVGGSY
jgi:hypothetical protein